MEKRFVYCGWVGRFIALEVAALSPKIPPLWSGKTDAIATEDIVWAYPKVTKHYHNGIPTVKTYSAMVRDSKGQSMEVSGKKDSVPKLLESLERRMPWILVGYTKELEALWQKQKPPFFQLMERRRTELPMASR